MSIYGYARISTAKQSIERQVRNIQRFASDAVIIRETFTGTKLEGRKELAKLLKRVKSGDTIIFDSVSRMSRDAASGFKLYRDLYNKGVELVFLKERTIDTAAYREAMAGAIRADIRTGDEATDALVNGIAEAVNAYMMALAERQIKLAFEQAQKEVDDLRERTKEGIETARLDGKQIGQAEGTKLTTKKSVAAKERMKELSRDFGGALTDADCMKLLGIARNTFYKYKRELTAEVVAANV